MKNKKSLLWLYAILSLVIIVAAVVVSLTAGISLGTDVGGGNQIEVKISAEMNTKDAVKKLESVLGKEGYISEKTFVEDKWTDTYVVAKTATKKIKNEAALKTAIAEKLEVAAEDVSILEFDGSVTNKAVIWTSVGVVCLLLALFVIGWVRYGVVSATTLTVVSLHALLMALSLFVLTRLPITMISIMEILASVVLVIFATILLLERIRENKKMKHNENLSAEEMVNLSSKEIRKPLIYILALSLIICIVLICVPVRFVILSALAMLVCVAVSVFSYYCLGTNLHVSMLTMQAENEKARLSRNVSPAPAAETKKKTAKKTTKKASK